MIKKVALVLGLFLVVDRIMYYKLGQTKAGEQQALAMHTTKPLHQLAQQEKAIRKKFVSLTRTFFKKQCAESVIV